MNPAKKRLFEFLDERFPAAGQRRDISSLEREVQRMFRETLGPDVQFNLHGNLNGYRRGRLLTLRELAAMRDGTVVWVYYKRDGDEEARVDGPHRITRSQNGELVWGLEDGSSFACEYDHTESRPECIQHPCGEGEMRLFHAERSA